MTYYRLLILLVISLYGTEALTQTRGSNGQAGITVMDVAAGDWIVNGNFTVSDSGQQVNYYFRTNCKGYIMQTAHYRDAIAVLVPDAVKQVAVTLAAPRFLTVHGNISYEYFSRSATDTSLHRGNFQQHTERVYLDLLFREKYPVKIAFTSRQSNSPFFRNFFDPNIQFDRPAFNKSMKQDMIKKLEARIPEQPDLKMTAAALKELTDKYRSLKGKLESPATLQKIIEQREREYNEALRNGGSGSDSTSIRSLVNANLPGNADSIIGKYTDQYAAEKNKLDSMSKELYALQKKYDSLARNVQKDLLAAKQRIYKATSHKELKKIAAEQGIEPPGKGKFDRHLAAVKQFSLGRNMLNYTELTAQNITITGINIEYNPSYYVAFAAGKIDYRFRDFFNKGAKQSGQYVVMGRVGIGDKERKAFIFSLFQGRKNQSEFALPDSVNNHVNLMGYSFEAIYKKDQYTGISAEFAKSTKPLYGAGRKNDQNNTLLRFSDNSNMGVNIKAQTRIAETNTKLNGFYRKTGEYFQSFSLFSYNTDQTAWLAAVDQSFLKEKIIVNAAVRQNDFTNPFTEKTFKTTTVFKSIILNVRVPEYPIVRIGYYPGTQLYVIDNERIRENAYYIINGSAVYNYLHKGIGMSTSVVYNRYINQATDSGFAAYRGINYYVSQSVYFKKLQLLGATSFARQPEMNFHTIETSADYSIKDYLRIGGGLKYNKIDGGMHYWGERLVLSAKLKKLGTLLLQYEKSYLPTFSRSLYPVETGRVTWCKYF